jgi:hypothetical protein
MVVRKKLAATCRGMTCCSGVARCKGYGHQGQGKDKAIPRTHKGWIFGKRCWVKPEGINRIRIQGLKKQLHLKGERTSGRIFGKTIGLEVVK